MEAEDATDCVADISGDELGETSSDCERVTFAEPVRLFDVVEEELAECVEVCTIESVVVNA